MKHFIFMFNLNEWKVSGFFPYTSTVIQRIGEQNHNYKTDDHDFLEDLGNKVRELAEAKGCKWDNKVVVELTYKFECAVQPKIYLGQYDGKWNLGLGVSQDEWLKDSNQHFE